MKGAVGRNGQPGAEVATTSVDRAGPEWRGGHGTLPGSDFLLGMTCVLSLHLQGLWTTWSPRAQSGPARATPM
eukprot:10189223-Lingulodinium_polyedra.AAC.1